MRNSDAGSGMVACSARCRPAATEAASLLIFRAANPRNGVSRMASPAPISNTEPKGKPFCLQNSFTIATAVSFCRYSKKPQFTSTETAGFRSGGFRSTVLRKFSRETGIPSAYSGNTSSTSEKSFHFEQSSAWLDAEIRQDSVGQEQLSAKIAAYRFELERGARGLLC